MVERVSRAVSRPAVWIAAVAVMYAVLQLTLLDVGRFYEWDEATYVAEVSSFTQPISLAAHRARGITYLVAPVTFLTDSLVSLRVYLVVLSSLALAVSYGVWVRVMGWGAVIAQALFGASWLATFYGAEVSPNLWVAFAAVTVVALCVRFAVNRSLPLLVGIVATMAVAALLRPSDALFLAAASIAAAMIVARGVLGWRLWVSIGGGFAIGTLPWVIESFYRFGDPFERLAEARRIIGGDFGLNASVVLGLADGPLMGPEQDPSPAVGAILWLLVVAALAVVGVAVSRRHRWTALAAFVSSAVLAAPYLVLTFTLAPRFLLPSYGLLACVAGIGLVSLYGRSRLRWVAAATSVVLVGVLFWHGTKVADIGATQSDPRTTIAEVAVALELQAAGSECVFVSQYGYPQIAIGSGCRGGGWVVDDLIAGNTLAALAGSGTAVFAISIVKPPEGSEIASWPSRAIIVGEGQEWTIYERPAG